MSYVDAQIGKVLDALDSLGLSDNTVVVLLGDHGWHLGEHGFLGKHNLMDEATHVPLIVRAPGMRKGSTWSMVEFVDLYPTLCELCGLPEPKGQLDGKSQWGGGDNVVDPRFSYAEWRRGDGSMVSRMLFDHQDDPQENRNISESGQFVKEMDAFARFIDRIKKKL